MKMKPQSSVRNQQDTARLLFCTHCSVACLWGKQQPLNLISHLPLLNFLPLTLLLSDVAHVHPGEANEMWLWRFRLNRRESCSAHKVVQERISGSSMQLPCSRWAVPGLIQARTGENPSSVSIRASDLQSSFFQHF